MALTRAIGLRPAMGSPAQSRQEKRPGEARPNGMSGLCEARPAASDGASLTSSPP
jgi:hypothetical protein